MKILILKKNQMVIDKDQWDIILAHSQEATKQIVEENFDKALGHLYMQRKFMGAKND